MHAGNKNGIHEKMIIDTRKPDIHPVTVSFYPNKDDTIRNSKKPAKTASNGTPPCTAPMMSARSSNLL